MIEAELDKQLMIKVNNKVGSLAEITSVISSAGINLLALCAYEIESMVAIMFVTEDNNYAKKLLEERNYEVSEEEVILLSLDNKPGALQRIVDRIAQEGYDLTLMFGSVHRKSEISPIVLITKNNLDVLMLIKTEFSRS